MVLQVQTHLGATGIVNTIYLVWEKKAAADRKWDPAKKYFCAALRDFEELSKLTTGEAGLTENAAVANKSTEQQVREEIAEKLGESFDTLAMATTAKNDTIEILVKTIREPTTTNSALTATFKKITNQLERAQSKSGQNGNNGASGGGASGDGRWPRWCNPNAYCFTCGYKLRRGHDSSTCNNGKGNTSHMKEATRQNTMGDRTAHAGFGNAPNGK